MSQSVRVCFFVMCVFGAGLLGQTRAEACGGLFCDPNAGVVNQTAERIIFGDNGDGTVTAVVQILYEGPADEFSWVLPVPGIPEVEVSSNLAFDRLQAATNPNYILNRSVEGECRNTRSSQNNGDFAVSDNEEQSEDGGGGVSVVASGSVGPYDYEVIEVDPDLEDPADVAVAWFADNGYDLTALGPEVLRPYLEEGKNLIGFRLTKNAQSGSIRPVMLTYATDHPCIPIRPTAVAVQDDMSIMTFVLGGSRAVPINYRHLELNDAAINWLNPSANYTAVVNLAADEAGGQGFVTEFAGASAAFSETVFGRFDREEWSSIAEEDWTGRHGELLIRAAFYSGWDGFLDAVQDAIPLPPNVTAQELAECVGCYYNLDDEELEGLDPVALIQAMETHVIGPMRDTQELIDAQPYLTRMLTSMSGREMTVDPGFLFNPDLPTVSNTRTADLITECSPDIDQADAPWRLILPDGEVVRGRASDWPLAEDEMPANREIRQMGTAGEGEVVSDNAVIISQAIERSNADFAPRVDVDDKGCACQSPAAPARSPAPLLSGLLLALLFISTRRR